MAAPPAASIPEKALEMTIDALISRVKDLESALAALIYKLENDEQLSWPSVLDSFALLSGHMNTMGKLLKSDKTPTLRNLAILPLELIPNKDETLERLTEGRVPIFSHEVAPSYLRTKSEPEIEEKEQQLQKEELQSLQASPDSLQKQLVELNRVSSHIADTIARSREEWGDDSSGHRSLLPQSSSQTDTNVLIAATAYGNGLKQLRPPLPTPTPQPTQTTVPGMSKLPSSIKTNIKIATNVHPYSGRQGGRGAP